MTNKASLAAIIGVVFIVLAVGGSIVTSRQMNKTADNHDMSAGRTGDARLNLNQDAASARGGKSPAPTSSSPK